MLSRGLAGGVRTMMIMGAVPPTQQSVETPSFDASTMADIQTRGRLRVAINYEIPRFCFSDTKDGQIRGFEVDLANVLAHSIFGGLVKDASKYVELIPIELPDRDAYATDPQQADVVLGHYADTPKRREFMDFAGHYVFSPQAALLRADAPTVKSADDLNALCITAVEGSSDADTLELVAPSAEVIDGYSVTDCMNALDDGRAQAFWASVAYTSALVKEAPEKYRTAPVRHGGERFGFGLRNNDVMFRDFIDDVVRDSFSSGELNTSLRRWLG